MKNHGRDPDFREKPRVDGVFKSLDREALGVEKGEDWGLVPGGIGILNRGLGASMARGISLA